EEIMRARTLLLVVPALGGLVLLGGCLKRTKISATYVLGPVAPRDAAAPSQTPEAVVGVLKVAVPGWIDRPQVTERTSTGQIRANEFARWGEPVTKGGQRGAGESARGLGASRSRRASRGSWPRPWRRSSRHDGSSWHLSRPTRSSTTAWTSRPRRRGARPTARSSWTHAGRFSVPRARLSCNAAARTARTRRPWARP